MSQFPIDIDAEAIYLDDAWYGREDLSRRIRSMLDQGDFNVARPSMALEELTQVLQSVRTLAFRSTPDLADALSELSARSGQTVGYLIREAVTQYITDANSNPPREGERRENTVRAPIPLQVMQQATGASGSDLPVIADVQAVVVAGPGAMRVAEAPVDLVVRKHQPPGEG